MYKKLGWILMIMASFNVVSAFADDAKEEEQKPADEVAIIVDDCGPAASADAGDIED